MTLADGVAAPGPNQPAIGLNITLVSFTCVAGLSLGLARLRWRLDGCGFGSAGFAGTPFLLGLSGADVAGDEVNGFLSVDSVDGCQIFPDCSSMQGAVEGSTAPKHIFLDWTNRLSGATQIDQPKKKDNNKDGERESSVKAPIINANTHQSRYCCSFS